MCEELTNAIVENRYDVNPRLVYIDIELAVKIAFALGKYEQISKLVKEGNQ